MQGSRSQQLWQLAALAFGVVGVCAITAALEVGIGVLMNLESVDLAAVFAGGFAMVPWSVAVGTWGPSS